VLKFFLHRGGLRARIVEGGDRDQIRCQGRGFGFLDDRVDVREYTRRQSICRLTRHISLTLSFQYSTYFS
jgi:hypothetical protein